MRYFPKFLFRKISNMTRHLIMFFWITFLKKLKNRQLNRKRTDSQNHASFEIRRFVTLAASFDLWTRSLGAIHFWELGMTIHYLGLFLSQWRVFSEGWLIFGEFGCFWKKKPQTIQFIKSKKLCRPAKYGKPRENLVKLRPTKKIWLENSDKHL